MAKNIKIEKEIEDRCREHFARYEDRIVKLEEAMAKKPDVEEVHSMIENSRKNEGTGDRVGENENQAIDALEEYKESMARRNNIIVFNAEESNEKDAEERREADISFIEGLCKTLEAESTAIKNVTRLGKKKEGVDNPRPLKLVFEDEKDKGRFMGRLKKLGNAEPKYKKISVVHDLTQKERQKNKEKWEECKEKNQETESGDSNFKYILKGPPWDRRVAKVKK